MEKDWSYDEILTHVINDDDFISRVVKPLENRLLKSIKKKTYNYPFALSLWEKIVDEAVEDYAEKNKGNVMFEGIGTLRTVFPKSIRKDLAIELTEDFELKNEKEISAMSQTSKLAVRVAKRFQRKALDQHAIVDLSLHIENTESLYKQSRYMEDNLHTKIRRGTYDHTKAPKLWQYLIDEGAKDYVKEFGGDVRTLFPKADRTALAEHYADVFAMENDLITLRLGSVSAVDLKKEDIPKETLNQYGELKKLVEGKESVVSTKDRVQGMQKDLSSLTNYSDAWLTEEDLQLENFLEFMRSY